MKHCAWGTWASRPTYTCGSLQRREGERADIIFEEIMDENVPNFMKDMNRNIQELKKKTSKEKEFRVPHSDNYNQNFKSQWQNASWKQQERSDLSLWNSTMIFSVSYVKCNKPSLYL